VSGHCHVTPVDGVATGFLAKPAIAPLCAVGTVEGVVGSCSLTRPAHDPIQIKPGDAVCRGDILETAAGGKVCIRFIDGTVFDLSDSARMVVKEFTGDAGSPAALFDISNGTFAFIAGEMAKAGRIDIDTPFGRVRGRTRAGGIGMLSLASLFLAAMDEAPAGPSDTSFLDDGNIRFKDLTSDYGVVELRTADGRTIVIDDPGETIVLRRVGSSISESHVTNSIATMLSYQNDQANALRVFALGPSGPAGNGSNGSGTPPPELPPLVPINLTTQPPPFDPPHFTLPPPGGANNILDIFVPTPDQPPPPVVPPSITISPTINTQSGVSATIASGGVTRDTQPMLSGTVSSPAGLSSVSVEVFDQFSGQTTVLGTATIDGAGNWSLTPTVPLSEGSHTFTAVATDAAGNTVSTMPVTAIVDTTPPNETISPTIGTDAGLTTTTTSGGVTKDNTLALSGTVGDLNGVSSVHVFDGATDLGAATIDGSGNWSLTTAPLSEGAHTFTAVAIDNAGNSTTSAALSVTIDTTVATLNAPVLTTATDTAGPGGSTGDNLTKDNAPDFTINVAAATAGDTIELLVDGNPFGTPVTHVLTQGEITTGSITLTAGALGDGLHNISVKLSDAAGNTSTSAALAVTIDTTVATLNAPDLTTATDTAGPGGNTSDNLTKDNTPDFAINVATATAGDTVELLDNGSSFAAPVTHVLTQGEITTGSITLTAGALGDGLHNISVKLSDAAGNTSTSSPLAVTIDTTATATPASATVNEAALDKLKDGSDLGAGTVTGSDPSSTAETATGTLTLSDANGPVTVTGVAAGNVGAVSGNVGTIITGSYGLLQIDQAGHYTYTLTKPYTTSPPANNAAETEPGKDVFTYTVTDTAGNTSTSTISINIVDDVPHAELASTSIAPTDSKTNVVLILDISGSMNDPSGLTGLSRLDVEKAAVNELLEQYDNRGDVMVQLITFSTGATAVQNASGSVWMNVADAKAALAGLSAGGNTNYEAALSTAMSAFPASGTLSGPGTQNVSYFLSDGDPTNPVTGNEQTAWESFLTSHNIISFGIGVGSGVSSSALNPVAFDPAPGTQLADTPIVVTDLSQLANTLVFSVPPISGAFVAGINGATDGTFGADGGHIQSITVGTVTYSFNPTTNTITTSDGSTPSYVGATHTLTVDTDPTHVGGELAVVVTTGAFTFQPTSGFTSTSVGYTLVDNDGDTSSNTLTFTAAGGVDHAPIVRDDHVITNISGNGASIAIPSAALLYNDTDADGNLITVTATSGASSGSVSPTNGNPITTVTFSDGVNSSNGGSFTYTGSTSSPSASDTGIVTVDRGQTTTTLTGTDFGEIFIGRNGANNTINANGGNDVLIGGTGNDTLNGGAGADLMTGGGGNDTFVFKAITDSQPGAGHFDTITDFTSGIDHLDFTAIAGANVVQQVSGAAAVGAHSIGWSVDTANNQTIVYVNTTGTVGHVDMEIHLAGSNITLSGVTDILHHA
jgi:VCBS repeat-containing protein